MFGSEALIAEGSLIGQVNRLARVNINARRPNRVVKKQFTEVPFGLGGLITRVHCSIRLPRQWNVGIGAQLVHRV
jgi:hypothetical protein